MVTNSVSGMNATYFSMGGIFTFKNEDLFGQGFKSGISNAECELFHMLMEDVLNLDGTIDVKMISAKQYPLRDLWKYVYYLWYHNKSISPVFQQMGVQLSGKSKRVTASAYHFIRTLMAVLQRPLPEKKQAYKVTVVAEDVGELINRILVEEYRNERGVRIPFIRKLREDLLAKLSKLVPARISGDLNSSRSGTGMRPMYVKPENIKVSVNLVPDSRVQGGIRANTKVT